MNGSKEPSGLLIDLGELNMAEKLDPQQVVTFEDLLRACLYEQQPLRRVIVRKGC